MIRALAVEAVDVGRDASELSLTELSGQVRDGSAALLWRRDGTRASVRVQAYDAETSKVVVKGTRGDELWPHSEVVFGGARRGRSALNEFIFSSDSGPAEALTATGVQIPTSVRTRAHMQDALERGLQSQRRFTSWEAALDGLRALDWIPAGDVRIVHTSTPFDGLADLGAYAVALGDGVRAQKKKGRGVYVVFPFGARERLELAIATVEATGIGARPGPKRKRSTTRPRRASAAR